MLAVKKRKTERRKRGPIIVVWVALECRITLRGLYPGILFFPAPVLCPNVLAMYLKSLKFRHLFFCRSVGLDTLECITECQRVAT